MRLNEICHGSLAVSQTSSSRPGTRRRRTAVRCACWRCAGRGGRPAASGRSGRHRCRAPVSPRDPGRPGWRPPPPGVAGRPPPPGRAGVPRRCSPTGSAGRGRRAAPLPEERQWCPAMVSHSSRSAASLLRKEPPHADHANAARPARETSTKVSSPGAADRAQSWRRWLSRPLATMNDVASLWRTPTEV